MSEEKVTNEETSEEIFNKNDLMDYLNKPVKKIKKTKVKFKTAKVKINNTKDTLIGRANRATNNKQM